MFGAQRACSSWAVPSSRIDSTSGSPYWASILELPYGTVDNSTLRWNDATGEWVENVNLLSDATGNTRVNGTM